MVAVFVFAGIALVILSRDGWLKFNIKKQYMQSALSFGIPLIPHTLGGILIGFTDRLFITKMVGLEATGIYTVGFQVGMIIGLIEDSFIKYENSISISP